MCTNTDLRECIISGLSFTKQLLYSCKKVKLSAISDRWLQEILTGAVAQNGPHGRVRTKREGRNMMDL